jgi:heterotetrameric sarcosine oxidase gamma subunit
MADLAFPLVATLPAICRLEADGLRIGPAPHLAVFALKLGPRTDVERLGEAIGVALPAAGRSLTQDGVQWLNVGPRAWLAMIAPTVAADFARRVREGLGDATAVLTEISDALAICEVRGAAAQALLAQGVALDFDRRMATRHVARTRLGAIAVTLVREDADAFRLIAPRPYAGYLAAWLTAAAQSRIVTPMTSAP